ncbi:CapA family protein [Promicromonospora sp. NPDC057138]|uniref:CapA family protein n=1 Tax=Promicromonospora sp. NPDC057138 TaxID=3346031 RepID=UPI0036390CBF
MIPSLRTRSAAVALVATAALVTVTGCASGTAGTGSASAEPSAEPEITLTFAGDVHFEDRVAELLDDPATTFGPVAAELTDGDLTVVNLETPITSRGTAQDKRYVFRAPDASVSAMTAAGIDVVSLANNHTMDYGREGLADTIATAKAGGLGTVGAGANIDAAFTPLHRTVGGVDVAIFAFSQVDDLAEEWAAGPNRSGMAMAFDTERAYAAVRAARADSDLVVVLPHWGAEGDQCPTTRQQDFAAGLIDAGADVIVGAHSHVLQGAGREGDAYVAYGMGNFLWYSEGLHQPFSARAGVLHLTVQGREVVRSEFVPTVMTSTGQSEALTGWHANLARHNFDALRACADLDPVLSDQ